MAAENTAQHEMRPGLDPIPNTGNHNYLETMTSLELRVGISNYFGTTFMDAILSWYHV